VIPRPTEIPGLGWGAIRPLQYGDLLRFYENAERSPAVLAAVFRRTVVGFEHCTAADVRAMTPAMPALVELAVLVASGVLDEHGRVINERPTDDTPDGPHAKPSPHDVDAPDDSMWAADNKPAHQQASEATFTDADMRYVLGENNETTESLYRMLLPEIRMVVEGAERAADRQDQNDSSGGTSSGAGVGNKTDRAAQLGLR